MMKAHVNDIDELRAECEALRVSLAEAEETLAAIRNGEADALVVNGPAGDQIYTLEGAAEPYRVLVEEMNQGAATLGADGIILYCNRHFSDLVAVRQDRVIGSSFENYTTSADRTPLRRMLREASTGRNSGEVTLVTGDGRRVLVNVALNPLPSGTPARICLLVTDLTERQKKELALLNLMEDLAESNNRLEQANHELRRQMAARQAAQQEVQQLNATLERRVFERTEQLRQSEERVQLALQVARAFAFEWSVGTDEVIRSPNCADILGIGANATRDTGHDFFQRVHPDDRSNFVQTVTALSRAHPDYAVEYRVVRPDGQVLVLQESATGTFDADGKLISLVGMTADITARVTAEQAVVRLNQELKRRMTELQTIFDTAPVGLAIADDPGIRHVRGNPSLEQMFGVGPGAEFSIESDQVRFRVIKDGGDMPADEMPMQRAGQGESVAGQILEIVRPDGVHTFVHSNAAPLRDENGQPYGVVGVFLDITESKRAEEALRQSELRFRNIYDTAPVSIWQEDWSDVIAMIQRARAAGVTDFREYFQTHSDVVDAALSAVKILDVNQWTVTMFEARDKSDLLASLATVFATPDTAPGFIEELVALASDQGMYRTEMTFNTVAGGRIHGLMAIAFPVLDSGSGSVLVSVVDITQRKRAEMELTKLAAELKAANKELESFAYSISHDLRAPLRSIDGFSRILLRDCSPVLDEKHRDSLQRVRDSSQHMGQLIDDLLELSRTTRADLHFATVDLTALAEATLEDLHRSEPERKVICDIQRGLTITADPALIRAALENLISNAWKFTRRRSDPHIEIGMFSRSGESIFFVRDNGVGFDMAYAGKLFGAFQRLHTTREFPGTGIGLATVQRILHRHGGRIWAEAAVDAGATFYFTVPTTPTS